MPSSPSIEQLKNNLLEKISEIQKDRLLAQKLECNPELTQSSVAPEMSVVSAGRFSYTDSRNNDSIIQFNTSIDKVMN